ncbi:transcription termination factor NusA [Spiroplasma tabanidicola]|uniref:Transcription termination/antitermination protein NusA n=1 Tax=Spiroplasma tabanidicola TaxID=324079 RepID=A0A6I6C4S7_9MOLU|nr:transcription termination factor NusA [Spiroplasma tabanidicola]QGS51817.1 transcription elongation factor NusA [Spiroplasma tabanidicola]
MIDGAKLLEAIHEIVDEKKIDREIIFEGIVEGFKKAYEKFFDLEAIIKVDIDEQTGQINVFKQLSVVQQVEDDWLEIGLNQAKERFGEEVTIGDNVFEPVKYGEDFSKLAVMQVGQIIKQKIREGEKNKLYEEFLSKNHEIVGGTVKDITDTTYLIDVDGSIIAIWNKKMIPGEDFDEGDRICFYVEEVSRENKHSQVLASRVHPQFLAKLMETQVPEIAEGIIEVKSVSREPGKRSKIAVHSNEENIDPIGACVGAGGNRIKEVSKELNGEKIDIVLWNEDKKTFIINALAPVKVISIDLDEEANECFAIVPNEQLSLAIGKKGMAARLVANLVNTKINIVSLDNAEEQGIDNLWNGNITQEELKNPDFINNVNKRKTNANNNANKFQSNFERPKQNVQQEVYDEIDESIYVQDSSLEDIQTYAETFESIAKEDDDQEETIEVDDDYDSYYEK